MATLHRVLHSVLTEEEWKEFLKLEPKNFTNNFYSNALARDYKIFNPSYFKHEMEVMQYVGGILSSPFLWSRTLQGDQYWARVSWRLKLSLVEQFNKSRKHS